MPYCWIDHQYQRDAPEEYNTCRGRAAVRWGPNKAGQRTIFPMRTNKLSAGERSRSHFMGENIDRYTNIDMYRRPPTNYNGRVTMDCGRPGDGYYALKYPCKSCRVNIS